MASALATLPPADKKPLDHSVYDGWNSIRGTTLSNDGQWLLYVVTPQEGDGTAYLRSVKDGHTITVPRGTNFQFTFDSKFAVGQISPAFAEARKARRDKAKPEDMPKSSLVVINLATGDKTVNEKVTSYQLAEEGSTWLLYHPEPPKPKPEPPKAAEAKKPEPKKDDEQDQRRRRTTTPTAATGETPTAKPSGKAEHKPGDPYTLRNLTTGKEEIIEFVTLARFDKAGTTLAYATSNKDTALDGVFVKSLTTGKATQVAKGIGHYPKLALASDANALAYTTDHADYTAKKPTLSLFLYDVKTAKTDEIGKDSLPKGWSINEGGDVSFTKKNTRLQYATSPKPAPDPEEKPDDEKVSVDVWTWHDPLMMPEQLLQANAERTRGYQAIYDLATKKSVQLASPDLRSVQVANHGDGNVGLATDSVPYRIESAYQPGYEDVYLVSPETGKRTKVFTRAKGSFSLSDSGKYLAAYNSDERQWYAIDTTSLAKVQASKGIPYSLADETDDHPDVASPYGLVGWTANDARMLIKDRFDIWSVDPTGKDAPKNLTNGRNRGLRFTRVDLNPDEDSINPNDLLLTSIQEDTKQGGIYRAQDGRLTCIVQAEKTFAGIQKAKKADTLVYSRQDFIEYPDLWLTNSAFQNAQKVSDANPQQKNYIWGKSELVRWTSLDGVPLQGILIKPENFDYGKKYPLITYFYERDSDNLFHYSSPAPSASTINLPLFASNGYCIFIPDIPYQVGYPGASALKAIVPGVNSIVSRGYIDPKRLGIQGQSWGGYQVAFLVTQTDMFAAAEAGAPVGDMFSAYGGIRYGTGVVRQMQYEHGQSRIGGTPWDSTLKYIENSPVFWLDRVKTPLMIMSNDKDGAVPHTQGIELFTGLKRLGKPAWLVVYNGEDHNIMERKNRKDFSIRLSQYFDYYLKGAPAPKWMIDGIPATEKGRTMGTELVK